MASMSTMPGKPQRLQGEYQRLMEIFSCDEENGVSFLALFEIVQVFWHAINHWDKSALFRFFSSPPIEVGIFDCRGAEPVTCQRASARVPSTPL